MLKNWTPAEIPSKEEIKSRLDKSRGRLYELQMQIKAHKLPVLVLFEGWGASGKGSTIGKVIKNIDPRFFKVATMSAPTEEELRKPFLYRYMKQIPENGKFTFLDSGWMDEVTKDCLQKDLSEDAYDKRIDSIKRFERQLTDNGYLVVKFFAARVTNDPRSKTTVQYSGRVSATPAGTGATLIYAVPVCGSITIVFFSYWLVMFHCIGSAYLIALMETKFVTS